MRQSDLEQFYQRGTAGGWLHLAWRWRDVEAFYEMALKYTETVERLSKCIEALDACARRA